MKEKATTGYKTRSYPLFAACGINCGLCPRYYTVGISRCPGCAGEGFSDVHPPCGILSCCQRKGHEYCFQCDEYPCKKYDNTGESDSFVTHKHIARDMEKAKKNGIEAYAAELNAKVKILEWLLENYDDGRRKGFFCLAVNLLELTDIKSIVEKLECEIEPSASIKENATMAVRLFQAAADEKGIELKLRK